MKSILLLVSAVLIASLSGTSQVTVTEANGTDDLSGTTYLVQGAPSSFDIEHAFWVSNLTDQTINIGCRRMELDVLDGTENTLCWRVCPPVIPSLSQPSFTSLFVQEIEAGATDATFAMHHRPNGIDGCASYRIEWFDDDSGDLLTFIDMIFDHSVAGACAVGLQDLLNNVDITLAPNPAGDFAALTLEGLDGSVEVQVLDVLGQVVSKDRLNSTVSNSLRIDTSSLRNGIYFVAINDGLQVQRTLKMNVRH